MHIPMIVQFHPSNTGIAMKKKSSAARVVSESRRMVRADRLLREWASEQFPETAQSAPV